MNTRMLSAEPLLWYPNTLYVEVDVGCTSVVSVSYIAEEPPGTAMERPSATPVVLEAFVTVNERFPFAF